MNAIQMIEACAEGQSKKFTGPACELCGEPGTDMLGAAWLCFECYGQELVRRIRREA